MRPRQTSKTLVALPRWTSRVAVVLLVTAVFTITSSAQQPCSDAQFVQRAFVDLLYRVPDSATVSFYTPLASSAGRQAVAASILASQEYTVDLVGGNPTVVSGFYQKYLGANPDHSAVLAWVSFQPIPDSRTISSLLGSTPYATRASTLNPSITAVNSRIVNQMFLDLLGRNGTSTEISTYTSQLNKGALASTVALAILATNEYNTRVIQHAYQRMLHRAPSAADVTFMLSAMPTSSRPDEDLLAALAGSAEYCNGPQQTATFGFVAPSDTYPALNSPDVPSNVASLPAVPFGPLDAAANLQILTLGAQAGSATDTSALQAQIDALQQQVTNDASTIAALQAQLTAAQQQAATDANTISSLQTQLNTLQGQLSAANVTIAALQTQVTNLQQQVSADGVTIGTLQALVNSLTLQLNAAATTIAAQEQTIMDIAGALLGHSPSKAAAMAAGSVAAASVAQASGNPVVLRQAQNALAKGQAEVTNNDFVGAVRDFKLAYTLATNASK